MQVFTVCGIRDQRAKGWDLGSQPQDQGSKTMESGSASARCLLGIRDRTVAFLLDQCLNGFDTTQLFWRPKGKLHGSKAKV